MPVCVSSAVPQLSDQQFPGRNPGDRLKLSEIQGLVAKDPELQNLSKTREQELKDNVTAARELKTKGARVSNIGAAMDAKATMARVDLEVRACLSSCSS